MTVRTRPRPPSPGVREGRVRWVLDRLREQEALIEEARRRARRRHQRYAALILGGLAVVVLVGFTGGSGGHSRDLSAASAPSAALSGQGARTATNGKIAFADGLGRLQVAAPDGSGAQAIEYCHDGGCGIVQPAWSPDGRQIAFVRGHFDLDSPRSTASLYIRDAEGSIRRLAGCGSCGGPPLGGGRLSWSRDGSWIAFSREGDHWTQSIWAVETASGKLRRLTDCQSCADVSPDWAPNGQTIVFNRIAREGSSLYTVRADGSHLTKFTNSARARNPQWSPDGRQIAFDDHSNISIANADGSDQRVLVEGTLGSGPGVPSWSPDGTKLAYLYTPGSPGKFTAEVWTMNADGSQKRRLYHSACCVMSWAPPIWSPDGTKIAFAATSANGTFVIAADGTGLRQLSTDSANGITWQALP